MRESPLLEKLPFCKEWQPEIDGPLRPTLTAHVRTWALAPVDALVCVTDTLGRKKGALISSHSELLDGNSAVHKSGFYGLLGIRNPWSCLPAQQFQDHE